MTSAEKRGSKKYKKDELKSVKSIFKWDAEEGDECICKSINRCQ